MTYKGAQAQVSTQLIDIRTELQHRHPSLPARTGLTVLAVTVDQPDWWLKTHQKSMMGKSREKQELLI